MQKPLLILFCLGVFALLLTGCASSAASKRTYPEGAETASKQYRGSDGTVFTITSMINDYTLSKNVNLEEISDNGQFIYTVRDDKTCLSVSYYSNKEINKSLLWSLHTEAIGNAYLQNTEDNWTKDVAIFCALNYNDYIAEPVEVDLMYAPLVESATKYTYHTNFQQFGMEDHLEPHVEYLLKLTTGENDYIRLLAYNSSMATAFGKFYLYPDFENITTGEELHASYQEYIDRLSVEEKEQFNALAQELEDKLPTLEQEIQNFLKYTIIQ